MKGDAAQAMSRCGSKMETMYTKEGIPVVTPETARELINELLTTDKTVEKRWLEDIMAENPKVAEFISTTAMKYQDHADILRSANSMVIIYRLLKMQGENNKLIEMLAKQGAIKG